MPHFRHEKHSLLVSVSIQSPSVRPVQSVSEFAEDTSLVGSPDFKDRIRDNKIEFRNLEINKAADMEVILIFIVLGILIILAILILLVLYLCCWPKRKLKRNKLNDYPLHSVKVDSDEKEKEQHRLTDGSSEDTEQEERRKLEEKLGREQEERQNREEKLRREQEERRKLEEKLGREQEERRKLEEKLGREQEERQNREEKLRREQEERRKLEEKLGREQEERRKLEEKLGREQEERRNREEKLRRAEEQKPKGHIGLRNQGATCYLNSVLQILFMTDIFRKTVERLFKPIDVHIAQLFIDLKSPKQSAATTERITSELKINVHEQQDAAEYFQKIMNMVNPEMSKVYQGELRHRTVCKNPGKEHPLVTRHESFYIIPICMEEYGTDSPISMQSCFDSYFEPVKTCEDDRVKCPTCKELVNTEITCNIHKFPPVLAVQLERFQLDYYNNYKKNTSKVEIQFKLSVKDDSEVQHKYDLFAVVKHSGSFQWGHYYAVIKSFEDHQWYEFNDSSVRKIHDLKNPFQCEKAFLLLYKKRSNESAAKPNKCDNLHDPQCQLKHCESITQTVSKEGIKQKLNDSDNQSRNETQTCNSISVPDPQPAENVPQDPDATANTQQTPEETQTDTSGSNPDPQPRVNSPCDPENRSEDKSNEPDATANTR